MTPRTILAGFCLVMIALAAPALAADEAPPPAFDYPTWDTPATTAATDQTAAPATDTTASSAAPAIQYPDWDTPAKPAGADLSDKAVKAAIERGIAYLKSCQSDDGAFNGIYARSYPHGETAIAVLAMRYGGVGVTDPAVEKGLKQIVEGESDKTYVNSLIAQALATIPPDKRTTVIRRRMSQVATFLTSSQVDNGMWTYNPYVPRRDAAGRMIQMSPGDNSNTQFAILALWKLAEVGVEFDLRALRSCENHFMESQLANGGWGYTPPRAIAGRNAPYTPPSTPSMTATGLATLHIFSDMLHLYDEGRFASGRAMMCGRTRPLDTRIDAAQEQAEKDLEAWFKAVNQRVSRAPAQAQAVRAGLSMHDLYYLYSVERVGAASGKKTLGSVDWYADGAKLLLDIQSDDGSWGPTPTVVRAQPAVNPMPRNMVETSLAILFLAKGSAPIFFNKLRYDGDWANDRRDVAHLAAYVSVELEQAFNWQAVDVKTPVDTWFDAPVLFLNGHDGPTFSDEEKKKLKDYVARGGFIFTEACCGRPQFSDAIRKLAAELWPDLKMARLPDDHPLFTRASHLDLKSPPEIEGLTDASDFTFLILSSRDLSCIWNQNLRTNHEDDFRFAINAYRYASRGKPIRSRLP